MNELRKVYTIDELAKEFAVSSNTIVNWTQGHTKPQKRFRPIFNRLGLDELAEAREVSVDTEVSDSTPVLASAPEVEKPRLELETAIELMRILRALDRTSVQNVRRLLQIAEKSDITVAQISALLSPAE